MIKDDGYKRIGMTPEQLGQLALAIQEKGHEFVQLKSGCLDVVGFLQKGKDIGDRIIFTGNMEDK